MNKELEDEWKLYIEKAKEQELDKIIQEENLKAEETKKYVNQAFNTGEMKSVGSDMTRVLAGISMFGNKDGISREDKKQTVFQKLIGFFERFFGL